MNWEDSPRTRFPSLVYRATIWDTGERCAVRFSGHLGRSDSKAKAAQVWEVRGRAQRRRGRWWWKRDKRLSSPWEEEAVNGRL